MLCENAIGSRVCLARWLPLTLVQQQPGQVRKCDSNTWVYIAKGHGLNSQGTLVRGAGGNQVARFFEHQPQVAQFSGDIRMVRSALLLTQSSSAFEQ